ncbi:MAG: AAA family ATPase [Mycolicibacterium neoaurum]|uniref:ATP-binding protein n=1 Tax=Mycolicibacterium neoaurum TaxID=1795 RepID=UPI002FFC4454
MNEYTTGPTIEELLDSAVEAINRQDHGSARSLARQVLAVDRDNLEAEELMAVSDNGSVVQRLTLLFVDVVDSVGLSTRLEPEMYSTVIRRYRDEVHRIVATYEGHIGAAQGDGLLITFGHPTPHENDAQRAVSAGLDIAAEVAALSRRLRRKFGFGIEVRVGVHRGVVTIDPVRDEVIGVGANLASRVCDLAEPGTVAISEAVRRVLREDFTLEPLPPRSVKGFDKPLEHFRVLAERTEAPLLSGPLVGRDEEVAHLRRCWEAAQTGTLTVPGVVFKGEGGIGKTRLADAAIAMARQSGAVVLGIYGSSFHTDIGLRPIRRLLEATSGIARDSDPAQGLRQLRSEVIRHGLDPEQAVPLLAPVLGIAPGVDYQPPSATAGRLYDQIADTVRRYLIAATGDGPAMLVFEDVHWYDEDTVEILQAVLSEAPGRLMVVITGREVPALTHCTTFELTPFEDHHSDLLVTALHPDLDDLARRAVVDRCDGMPLYIEEVVAKMRSAPAESTETGNVPDTLYEALVARLRLNERAWHVIEAAALIGSQVDQALLAAVVELDRRAIEDILDELTRTRVMKPFGNGGWRFRHELLREVAAELLPPSARKRLHTRIGTALVSSAADGTPEWPLVAHHYEQGEQFDEAADSYEKAAADARRRGALNEARSLLSRALDSTAKLPPDTQARDAREVAIRLERGFLGFAAAGHASVDAAADFERCLQIIDNHPGVEMFATFSALWSFFASRGDLRRSAQLVDALRTNIADMPQWYQAVMDAVVGSLALFRGELNDARSWLESAAAAIAEMESPEIDGDWYAPNDPVGGMYALLGLTRYLQGDLESAVESFAELEKRCQALIFPHGPFTECYGRVQEAVVRTHAGQCAQAIELAGRIAEIATENGLDEWVMISATAAANAGAKAALAGPQPDMAALGESTATLATLVQVWRDFELKAFLCWYDAGLTAALLGAGDVQGARRQLDMALQMSAETSWHLFDAELLRLRAHTQDSAVDRDADLENALELSRTQGAVVLELAVAADRLRIHGDRCRADLEQVIARLPADQDWPALAEARALLH